MQKIDRRLSACPVPPAFSLLFRKAEDGEVHGVRVGDSVKFHTSTYGVLNPYPVGKVTQIEILKEDITGDGEEVYARFYIRSPGSMGEVCGIDRILEIVE
jgi:hypothetical protein